MGVKINIPNIFNQMDIRWANILLGFNSDSKYDIYNYGCLLTCFAMFLRYCGKEVDPLSLNEKMKAANCFTKGSGLYIYGSISKVYSDIKETCVLTPDLLTDAQINEIRTSIDNGFPVITQIDYNPKTVSDEQHFVMIIGYNPAEENDFLIADPLGGVERSLKDYLGWYKPSARKTIAKYLILTGPKPKVDSNMIVLSKDDCDRRTHGNEQWIKTIGYLGILTDPFLTLFEDAQKVIAGFKSRVTDIEAQLSNTKVELEKANTEINNQKDKVANVEADCQNRLKIKEAEITALSEASKDLTKLRGEYTVIIDGLRGDLKESQKQVGIRDLKITELNTQIDILKKGGVVKTTTLTDIISSIIKIIMKGFIK